MKCCKKVMDLSLSLCLRLSTLSWPLLCRAHKAPLSSHGSERLSMFAVSLDKSAIQGSPCSQDILAGLCGFTSCQRLYGAALHEPALACVQVHTGDCARCNRYDQCDQCDRFVSVSSDCVVSHSTFVAAEFYFVICLLLSIQWRHNELSHPHRSAVSNESVFVLFSAHVRIDVQSFTQKLMRDAVFYTQLFVLFFSIFFYL